MAIKIEKATEARLVASIQRYFATHMDEPIGNMQAAQLLDFFLAEVAPTVYNQAIADAQHYMHERTMDLPANCFEPEQTYW
ncbi:hypothetical protein IGB42_03610 [Andreprevotia sp. IGB-42]|uniref:DUF2164 domain-containing protein n=1 Tax=Andreprevotia sp. IGB-42 TaxID=2497473 RepID=UPI00135CD52F|nr:DUF2164 domain-containing protein [Andreprevotia sp. IGB-42]KAF0811800.1 hypothetical protein IGB42_03610 [Andreprevotia sp. IGB-42]